MMAAVTVFDSEGVPHYGLKNTDRTYLVLCGADIPADAETAAAGITEHHCPACKAKAEELAGQ